ncbi:MAG: hypothetical protein AMJ69_06885, partial [Gammaproteobacteria bacterium SG8_47]
DTGGGTGGDTGGGTGGDTGGGTGGDTGGGTGGATGTASPLGYSGTDLDALGDGVVTPLNYPNRDLPETLDSDGVAWVEIARAPEPQLVVSLFWGNGELTSVTFVASLFTEALDLLGSYQYAVSCSTSPDVCAAVSFDVVNQSVTFNNVVLPVANSITENLATSPVTLNGTLPMYAP